MENVEIIFLRLSTYPNRIAKMNLENLNFKTSSTFITDGEYFGSKFNFLASSHHKECSNPLISLNFQNAQGPKIHKLFDM